MSDSDLQLTKPAACPKCHATDVRRIIYGRPTPESFEKIQRGEAALGHCFVEPWLPDWRCGVCRHEWFVADDQPSRRQNVCFRRSWPTQMREGQRKVHHDNVAEQESVQAKPGSHVG